MRRMSGFTLIELMITVVIVAIITAIAYPSYVDHVRRATRSQGQQYLMDLAQRQEQVFLDQRAYTDVISPGGLNLPLPADLAGKYSAATVTLLAGPPAGYRINLAPAAGSSMVGDGTLVINHLQQRWRETDGNNAVGANDCRWEDGRCKPT